MWTGKGDQKHPIGEVGLLTEVHIAIADPRTLEDNKPYNRIYLFTDYRDSGYIGCLLFDDAAACRQIGEILLKQIGKSIEEIARIDLNPLL